MSDSSAALMELTTSGPPSRPPTAASYAEATGRLNSFNVAGGTLLQLATLIPVWGQWRTFATVAVVNAAIVSWNAWFNLVLVRRWTIRRAELVRNIVNVTSTIFIGHTIHWALPVWLFLPFVALAFEQIEEGVADTILVAFCVGQGVVAVLDGIPWTTPLLFIGLAVFCSRISKARFSIMQSMLLRSESQRHELEAAHRSLSLAHRRLSVETSARERAEIELRHAQKLEAVGRLAAGVAHEINTPIQFVGDSIAFVREAATALTGVLERYRSAVRSATGALSPETLDSLTGAEMDADLEYVLENLQPALERSVDGLQRVTTIVHSMKEFAHPDENEMTPVDMNQAIRSTLVIARHEYKYVAELETDFGDLPAVVCHGGDVNQCILNVVVNAAHAIGDVVKGTDRKGSIVVRTRCDGDRAHISISDTGGGIPEAIRDRVFEPFFTTKEVGRGTGQGLAITRSVIVDKHGGDLSFESEVGRGTTFHIRLPIEPRPRTVRAAVEQEPSGWPEN